MWSEFKENTKVIVEYGNKTTFWYDDWHVAGKLATIFPDIHNLVLQQQKNIAELWTDEGWSFIFRRHPNDWEIQRVAEFLRTIEHFSGLQEAENELRW